MNEPEPLSSPWRRWLVEPVRASFGHVPATLRLVWQASRPLSLAMIALTAVGSGLPLAVAWVGKRIVDAIVAHDTAATVTQVLIEAALIAGISLTNRLQTVVTQILGARLSVDINLMILEHALRLRLADFEDPNIYDQLSKARREASSRPLGTFTSTFAIFQALTTLLGYAALLIGFGWLAVVGLVVATIPATIAEVRFSKTAWRLRNWRSPDTRLLGYIEFVLANDQHAKEVRLFSLGRTLVGRYRALGEKFFGEDRDLATRRAFWAFLLSLLATGAFYGCYGVVALQAARAEITLGTMTLYLTAFRQGQASFQTALSAIGGMYENNLYMSNLFGWLAIPGERVTAPALPELGGERGIRFEGVGFRYPGAERWALRHVDLFIPAGQSVALVGHNGAGKTTMIKLLTRLYEPTEGRVLLDGVDLRDWPEVALRSRMGVLFQDFNQYQFNVRENIGFGSVEDLADTERVERAADRGGAAEVIAKLPNGLDTGLGRWFEKGSELSGGQWQKIALSRAYMREQADVLVLDEPTAALDAESEHKVFERFRELTRGRTSLLISHRFPTVRMADRIVVIEGGEVIEQGTHDELLAADGRYAELFRLQAMGYQ